MKEEKGMVDLQSLETTIHFIETVFSQTSTSFQENEFGSRQGRVLKRIEANSVAGGSEIRISKRQ